MSFLDRIKSIVNDTKEKHDEPPKNTSQEIKDEEIQLTWHVHKQDPYRFVRVVHYNGKRLTGGAVTYRTLSHIREIENTNNFSVSSSDASKALDIREHYHRSDETNDKDFRERFQYIETQATLTELEERYQGILRAYGERLREFEDSLNTVNTTASQADYNDFLGIQEPTPARESVDLGERPPFSGAVFTDPAGDLEFIRQIAEAMTGEGTQENTNIEKEPETQDNPEPEIILKDKKRLEKIE